MLETNEAGDIDERGDADDEPVSPRFSFRRRVAVWLLLGAFAAALAYPFWLWPRTRYLLTAVPQVPADRPEVPASAIVPPAALARAQAIVADEVRRGGFPGGCVPAPHC